MNQWWIYIPLIVVVLMFITKTISSFNKSADEGTSPGATDLYFPIVIISLTMWFILSMKLQTMIKDDGIYVRLFPIHFSYKHYRWDDLEKIYVRKYNPIMEYGGWGLKGTAKNRAFNLKGNIGLQLVFNDGKKILIGTDKQTELTEILISLKKYRE